MSQTNQLIFSHTTYSILQIHRWVKVESKRMGSSVAKTSENGYIVVKHNECRKTETRQWNKSRSKGYSHKEQQSAFNNKGNKGNRAH